MKKHTILKIYGRVESSTLGMKRSCFVGLFGSYVGLSVGMKRSCFVGLFGSYVGLSVGMKRSCLVGLSGLSVGLSGSYVGLSVGLSGSYMGIFAGYCSSSSSYPIKTDSNLSLVKVEDSNLSLVKVEEEEVEKKNQSLVKESLIMNNRWLNLINEGYISKSSEIFNPSTDSLNIIDDILYKVGRINKKGFVNSTNLFDIKEFPVLGDYSKLLLVEKPENVSLNDRIELGKWSFNLIMLELLYMLEVGLYKANQEIFNKSSSSNDLSDLIENYKELIRVVMSKIEPSIKQKIQKGGITVIHNTYTGFDTEYQNIDLKYNELLSVQLAVNTKASLKMPLIQDWDFSKIETLSGKVYSISKKSKDVIDLEKIKDLINEGIKGIRYLKYGSYDSSLLKIIKILKDKKVSFVEIKEKSSIIFTFERTPIETWFKLVDKEGFTFSELVRKSNEIALNKRELERSRLLNILKNIHHDKDFLIKESGVTIDLVNNITKSGVVTDKEEEKEEDNLEKPSKSSKSSVITDKVSKASKLSKSRQYTRTKMQSFSDNVISVTEVKNNYIIGHLTNADLSVLKDFDDIKDSLDIVNGCFVTIGKPILMDNVNVSIRDTMLLAPGAKKSLAAIGSLYDKKLHKINIGDRIKNMKLFLKENPELFEEYASKDALIALIHASYMEDFNFRIGVIGIPITLSTLSKNYILNKWRLSDYKGYQITSEFLLGDAFKVQTPQGLNQTKSVGTKMSLYISNYKGGRNESFMYGIDNQTKWVDYDLISAYTTSMAMLGDPHYEKGRVLTEKELLSKTKTDILYSYIIIKCTFKFPDSVKYPSIPCYLDKTTTVYALKGSAVLTGAEYLLAKTQGCEIKIEEIYYIPFRQYEVKDEKGEKGNVITIKPFEDCIRELQSKRVTYPKGSINNLIYKDIGNSIYGLTVKGMSNKMKFDIKTKQSIRMNSGILSNPMIASWTTALIRSVIGELLHNIQREGGLVVSVTTDGFITNIENLETVLKNKNENENEEEFSLFKEYNKMRAELSGNDTGLEIKKETKGIVSWSTRGQFSKEGLKASTGFQSNKYDFDELDLIFKDIMNSEDKTIKFVQTSLRSALDIYKKGGHVTPTYTDRIFRMWYDNRRRIEIPKDLEAYFSNSSQLNYTNILLDSKPLKNLNEGALYRYFGNLNKTSIYVKRSSSNTRNTYKSYLELAIRNFLKGLMNSSFNLDSSSFDNYKDIIDYIHQYNPVYKITPNNLAQIKRNGIIKKSVVKTKETLEFVEYIKIKFPKFDEVSFFDK